MRDLRFGLDGLGWGSRGVGRGSGRGIGWEWLAGDIGSRNGDVGGKSSGESGGEVAGKSSGEVSGEGVGVGVREGENSRISSAGVGSAIESSTIETRDREGCFIEAGEIDGEGGEVVVAAENARNDVRDDRAELGVDGAGVKSCSIGGVRWTKREADGGGGLSGNTDHAHVVARASDTIESGGDKLLENRSGLAAARAEGSTDVERTGGDGTGVETSNDGLDGAVVGSSASLRGGSGLPLGCRLRVSGSRKGRLRDMRTNRGRRRRLQQRETEQRSQGP